MARSSDRDIYEGGDWANYRAECEERRKWYDGTHVKKIVRGVGRDPVTKELPELYPLRLNPVATFCTVHQAIMAGVQPDISRLPVDIVIARAGLSDEQSKVADQIERFLARIFVDGTGLPSIAEAMLMMQYYGGHVFQVNWDPANPGYRYGMGVVSQDDPSRMWPIAVSPDRRTILECYIGYYISPSEAKALYNLNVDDQVLYMEHWTPGQYSIHVNDRIVSEGEVPWGRVPVVYIPHTKGGGFFGESLVDGPRDLTGMVKELNSRMADAGEIVQDSRPIPTVKNIAGTISTRTIRRPGQTSLDVIDLGSRTPLAAAGDPEMDFSAPPSPGSLVENYPQSILRALMVQGHIASVALGMDDVSGGRITGPVTAYRMMPTLAHTTYERLAFSQGMMDIASIAMDIAASKGAVYGTSDRIERPPLPDWNIDISCLWQPAIPIEKTQKTEELNARLQAGGVSLFAYLTELGCQDPDREIELIWQDRERQAQIDAEAQATAMEARFGMQQQQGAGNGSDR